MPRLPKRLLGRILYETGSHAPGLRPLLTRWGLRTKPDWFEGKVPLVRSRRTGRELRLPSFSRNYLSFELFWKGLDYYEPITLTLALMLVPPRGLFIDAGANIGFYSLMLAASRPELEIIAFEPHPRLNALLVANVQANSFTRVQPEAMALSAQEGILPFYLNRSDMSASLERSFDSNQEGVVSVPTTSLDGYLAERANVPDRFLMKVDIEGHEPAFFSGAEQTLRRYRPDIIAEAAVPYPPETIALLRRVGYTFRQVSDQGLIPCAEPAPQIRDPYIFLNCLLSTRPPAELDALSAELREQVRSIDLNRTSKRADHRVLDRSRQTRAMAPASRPEQDLAG